MSKEEPEYFSDDPRYIAQLEDTVSDLTEKFFTRDLSRREWIRLEVALRNLDRGNEIGTYRAAIQLPKDNG